MTVQADGGRRNREVIHSRSLLQRRVSVEDDRHRWRVASSTETFIRKRPSEATAYCGVDITSAFALPPERGVMFRHGPAEAGYYVNPRTDEPTNRRTYELTNLGVSC